MQRKKNSVSKSRFSTSRDMVSFAISAILHVSFVIAIALIPQKIRKSREVVDLTVSTVKPEPEVVEASLLSQVAHSIAACDPQGCSKDSSSVRCRRQ